jgi:hypothetical protein
VKILTNYELKKNSFINLKHISIGRTGPQFRKQHGLNIYFFPKEAHSTNNFFVSVSANFMQCDKSVVLLPLQH